MSLSINETKVAELLKSSHNGYKVENVPMVVENCSIPAYPVASEVSGTIYAPPPVTAETRERLMSVRRQIEESGVPLKSAEELTNEIGQMRGRR